jgi:hypothetical protein
MDISRTELCRAAASRGLTALVVRHRTNREIVLLGEGPDVRPAVPFINGLIAEARAQRLALFKDGMFQSDQQGHLYGLEDESTCGVINGVNAFTAARRGLDGLSQDLSNLRVMAAKPGYLQELFAEKVLSWPADGGREAVMRFCQRLVNRLLDVNEYLTPDQAALTRGCLLEADILPISQAEFYSRFCEEVGNGVKNTISADLIGRAMPVVPKTLEAYVCIDLTNVKGLIAQLASTRN